jgi:DNA-binding response OmpR family regulator
MAYAPRILILEDEPAVAGFFDRVLSEQGYYVTAVRTGRAAQKTARDCEFDLAVLDMSLPDMDGTEAILLLRAECPHLRILAVSGMMAGLMPRIAMVAGANAALGKPMRPHVLLRAVYELLDPSGSWSGVETSTALD